MYRGIALLIALGPFVPLSDANIAVSERPLMTDSLKFDGISEPFLCDSRGWYWVYEGVAHGQSFVAGGTRIDQIWLRPAQLNRNRPRGDLRVEIRDPTLRTIYAQGHIRPAHVERTFRWHRVELSYRAPLRVDGNYVLLASSASTDHKAPWVLNAAYRDIYPDGRHLGHADDLLFRVTFDAQGVWVGPRGDCDFVIPINSGTSGSPCPRKPAIAARRPKVPESGSDPIGPVPEGVKCSFAGKEAFP